MAPQNHNTFYGRPDVLAITVEEIDRVLANIQVKTWNLRRHRMNETGQVAIGRHGSQLERSLTTHDISMMVVLGRRAWFGRI